jgi:hypothetical protein
MVAPVLAGRSGFDIFFRGFVFFALDFFVVVGVALFSTSCPSSVVFVRRQTGGV